METLKLKITNPVGLHARPASEFVKLAAKFKSRILVQNLTRASAAVDAKSILSVLTLGVERDHEIELRVEGEDEAAAMQALRALIESDFAAPS